MTDLLVRGARRVGSGDPVDVLVQDGRIAAVGTGLPSRGAVLHADGRWVLPGLWDAHVHLGQWARSRQRLDASGTASPQEVTARVAAHVAGLPPDAVVLGYGHRSATWSRPPTTAELDAAAGGRAVVLCSGDAHHGWLSSRAQALLGLPPSPGVVEEEPWFAAMARLEDLPGAPDALSAYRAAVADAAARGVVGVVDMEWEDGAALWPGRVSAGVDLLRVQVATYPVGLDALLASGRRDGDPLGTSGLLTTGPLKVIFDGSLNTATACCREPYLRPGGVATSGALNLTPVALIDLLGRATGGGLRVAVHAIGDAAVGEALTAIEAAGARGSIEHAQLIGRDDLARFGALGVVASVQPAHLLDDRDVSAALWPDRQDRCFPLRSLLDAGAGLALGSDAPVSPLDPWLAMAAAVHRSGDDRPAWQPQEALSAAEALRASVRGTLSPGEPGDLVLLEADPLAPQAEPAAVAAHLRAVPVHATVLAGRCTYGG